MNENNLKKFLNQTVSHEIIVGLVLFFTIPAIVIGFWFGYQSINNLSLQVKNLSENLNNFETRLASTTLALEENIYNTQTSLEAKLAQERQNLESKLSNVETEVGSVSGTVNTLEKLSKTDPELLQKYSKVFFLNEHYSPPRLVEIPNMFEYYEEKDHQIHADVWPYLEKMLIAGRNNGRELYIYSAYRSFDTQESLKGQYTVTYGAGTANQFSADQGYSEHQLGTTVDLITTGIGGTLEGFEKTDDYNWLLNNAHKYGFILSYPKNNNYYVFEPWHWRFVGVELATYLYNTNQNFYDLDQREIDEYLVKIFD